VSEISRACGGGDAGRSLVPGALRGYRTWRPARRSMPIPAGLLPITSVSRRRILWSPRLTARCTPPDPGRSPAGELAPVDDHDAPHAGCDCGIYAWYAPDDTRIMHAAVFGVVEATGLVLLGDRGFRAQQARVVAVVTRNRRVAAACTEAGIAVYRRRRHLVRDFPPDDLRPILGDPEGEADGEAPADGDAEGGAAGTGRARRDRTFDKFDRTLVLAVWGRTALVAFAIAALPAAVGLAAVAVAELALIALVASRLR
jgi:hypothetical protein